MVARQALVRQEPRLAHGRIVRALEDRGALVHLVEHRLVDHGRPRLAEGGVLRPEESPLEPRDLVERGPRDHVVPAEAGEDDRQEILVLLAAPGEVALRGGLRVASGGLGGAEPADRPGADDVRGADDFVELGVLHAVPLQRAPVGGHAEHHRAAAVVGIALQEAHELEALVQRVLPAVAEPDAPHGDDRPAAVAQVGGVLRDRHAVDQQLPVLDHSAGAPSPESREVVHHRVRAAVAVGPLAAVAEHGGELAEAGGVRHLGAEALHEHAVDPVVLHPLEVADHRLAVERAVHLRRPAVGVAKGGRVALVGIQFATSGQRSILQLPGLKPRLPLQWYHPRPSLSPSAPNHPWYPHMTLPASVLASTPRADGPAYGFIVSGDSLLARSRADGAPREPWRPRRSRPGPAG